MADRPTEPMKERLPPGSRKILEWDGTNWHGLLTVPGAPPFKFVSGSEKRCCWGLDDLYRQWAAQQTKDPANA